MPSVVDPQMQEAGTLNNPAGSDAEVQTLEDGYSTEKVK